MEFDTTEKNIELLNNELEILSNYREEYNRLKNKNLEVINNKTSTKKDRSECIEDMQKASSLFNIQEFVLLKLIEKAKINEANDTTKTIILHKNAKNVEIKEIKPVFNDTISLLDKSNNICQA